MVLAAQFESFTSAFILVATVPFGLAAAVFAMLLTPGSLNIYSEIALVLLFCLLSNNGLQLVRASCRVILLSTVFAASFKTNLY